MIKKFFYPPFLGVVFLLPFFPSEGLAQDIAQAGKTSKGKPFILSADVRGSYDDNVNTSSDGNEDAAWALRVTPSIQFLYPMDNTSIEAGYAFGYNQFFGREGDEDVDFTHDFNFLINHRVNNRLVLSLRNRFSFDQEDALSDGAGFQRRLGGDRVRNNAALTITYDITERFSTLTNYSNEFVHYFDDPSAFNNNYLSHEVSQQIRFQALQGTTPFLNYEYETFDYDEIARDRDSHRALAGVDHFLLPEWLVSARVGAEFTLFDNSAFSDNLGPFASVRTIWNYDQRSNMNAGYSFGTNVTDNGSFASSQAHTFNVEWRHYWTPKFNLGLSVQYQLESFDTSQGFANATQDVTEQTITPRIRAAYDFTDYLAASVTYSYTEVLSDLSAREYERNLISFGITGRY